MFKHVAPSAITCDKIIATAWGGTFYEKKMNMPWIGRNGRNHKLSFYDRLWEKILLGDPNECWPWQAAVTKAGYGIIWSTSGYILAHRAIYQSLKGIIPQEMQVCHKCDNRRCCNPNHLFLGTPKDNTHDMIAKGRAKHDKNLRGEKHGMAKLSQKDVVKIRELYATGFYSQYELGRQFGVTNWAIYRIVHHKTWKHI